MSDFVSRMPANEFGMPLLPDYGVDDYSNAWMDDAAVAVLEPIRATKVGSPVLTAVEINLSAPAKRSRRRTVTMSTGVTLREPDMFDEGRAWWFGPDGVVDVNIAFIDRFQEHLRTYDRFALGAYRVRSYADETYLPSLNAIYRTCCGG